MRVGRSSDASAHSRRDRRASGGTSTPGAGIFVPAGIDGVIMDIEILEHTPKGYEVRVVATPDNKRIVLEIADKYDRLAEVAKKRMNAPMIKKRKGEP